MILIKKISKCCLLFLIGIQFIFTACTNQDNAKENSSIYEAELMARIDEFNQAFHTGDIQKLESMLTSNYRHTNSNSKAIHKNTWLEYATKRKKEIEAGTLKVHTYEMTETEVQFYDNTAIVTAKILVSSTKNRIQQDNAFRVTNIWVREGNSWKRAGFHDGKIK
ncbi:nuclear transport factor 2 family protein [Aquimarina sp. AU474]|uniref:nuclear transport factor 2 family protein n=1 Tax=Aquimarina sp. AU474 TaxID=2108529 RepID=UPI001359B797|nr:nuclear transport factor 2 family protein [Aquimarina sp. AU474]